MQSNKSFVLLGAGSWGSALANLLASNGFLVRLWSHDPVHVEELKRFHENRSYLPGIKLSSNISFYADLHEALEGQRDILINVPSRGFRILLEKIKTLIQTPVRISWGTKGFDAGTHMLLHQVVMEVLGAATPLAVLSGPSFAREVASQKPTAVSLSGNDESWLEYLTQAFHSAFFRVYRNKDLIGVQICGAIKNVIAIAVGVIDGLDLGANARSALITRGLAEISRLTIALGGQSETMLSLAGVGDLVLTCTDNQSRNRRFGLAIGQGKTCKTALKEIGQAVEGFANTKEIFQLAQRHHIEMPIVEQTYEILYRERPVAVAVQDLLSRAPKDEG